MGSRTGLLISEVSSKVEWEARGMVVLHIGRGGLVVPAAMVGRKLRCGKTLRERLGDEPSHEVRATVEQHLSLKRTRA